MPAFNRTPYPGYRRSIFLVALCAACHCAPSLLRADSKIEFQITFDKKVRSKPFTGRVLLFLSEEKFGEPRLRYSWTSRRPLFSTDVKNWKPGKALSVKKPAGFPYDIADLPPGDYRVQAVMHVNPDIPHAGDAAGNLYSKPKKATLDPAKGSIVKLRIDRAAEEPSRGRRMGLGELVELKSACLSKFHGRDITMRAAVIPPDGYNPDKDTRYPTLYVIPGFGGDHRQAAAYSMMLGSFKTPFFRVGIDPTCGHGHHVFADSDNNGPCGRALVEELIPHLEKKYRMIADSHARFLTGHSSGGWSSLWLQVTYPDFFGGTWSTSPDSMDFHDFCGIDLYAKDANLYLKPDGERRPIMRNDGEVKLFAQDFIRREDVLGPGGQIDSFEAVFGPRGKNGRPVRLFDRKTGRVDPRMMESWRRYDIVDKLKREWSVLGPRLAGKITVIMGDADTFYLEGATKRLKAALSELKSDARVFIEPDKDHETILWSEPFRAMYGEMSDRFLEWKAGGQDTPPKNDS